MRKYQPIWEQVKKHSTASLVAPVEFHRKIIQAVRKERTRDKGWAYDQSLLGGKPELAVDIDGERIRFYLRDRKGSDALGI